MLNVGPRADGTIPEQSSAILVEVGEWLSKNGEFLSHSTRSPFTWSLHGHYTTKGNVETGEKVLWEQANAKLYLRNLPTEIQDKLCLTIAIEVEGTPKPIRKQTSFWIPGYEV
ncbi:alpha-L-fucosidase [Paenibacillus sp. strain BS8-2]